MGLIARLTVVGCLLLWALPALAAPADQTLAIRESDASYLLTVPVSRLVMAIPKGGLEIEKAAGSGSTASPRYFQFFDRKRGVVASGWFESAQSYGGFDAFWKGETDAWVKAHLPAPVHVSFAKRDGWETVSYDLEIPGGYNTHIRAEYVDQGTWIDLHISATTAASIESARESALGLLKSIRVTAVP